MGRAQFGFQTKSSIGLFGEVEFLVLAVSLMMVVVAVVGFRLWRQLVVVVATMMVG